MHSLNKMDLKYIPKSEKPSKVLLVCVYDTVVLQITYEIIKGKFQKFGLITKILIFQKAEVSKFFIEFENLDSATKAKNTLDGTKLNNSICKMSIYYSNFGNVDLKHQTSEGFSNQNIEQIRLQNEHGEKNPVKDNFLQNQYEHEQMLLKVFQNPFNPYNCAIRSKTDDPKTLQTSIKQINQKREMGKEEEVDHQIKHSIDSILGPIQQKNIGEKEQGQLKMKQETDVRSSILWFNIRYPISCTCIYNLFSNFGNISCIVVKKDRAFVKFRTRQFSAIALTYLNNTIFLGNILDLRECSEKNDSWRPTEGEYSQSCFYEAHSDRFTPHRSITINPPSHTLHVSSMKRETCQEDNLYDIFGEYGEVEKIYILQQSREKNMALIKFCSVQDSFNAISHLHNELFSGRKIQISFTKSKI